MITISEFEDIIQYHYMFNEQSKTTMCKVIDYLCESYDLTIIESSGVIAKLMSKLYQAMNSPVDGLFKKTNSGLELSTLALSDIQYLSIAPHDNEYDCIRFVSSDMPVLDGHIIKKQCKVMALDDSRMII